MTPSFVLYCIVLYGTYSNSNKSISTLYKVSFMIYTAATLVAQVNNKTVQIVCIESNAHCIKESNYIDLLNQECRLKQGTNSDASFRKPEFCLGSANLWLCEKYSGSAIELGVHLLGFL